MAPLDLDVDGVNRVTLTCLAFLLTPVYPKYGQKFEAKNFTIT